MKTRLQWRTWLLLLLVCLAMMTCLAGLVLGAVPVPVPEVMNSLLRLDGPRQDFIVLQSRLPRTLLAALTGASLALSGAVIQALLRNPLASPKIVGINSGAALAVLAVSVLRPDGAARMAPVAAAVGGMLAAALVWVLAGRHRISPARLTLIGIAIGFSLDAGVEYLLVTRANPEFSAPLIWLTGSLWGRGWSHLNTVWPALLIIMGMVLFLAYRLDLLRLGQERAAGLGVRVGPERTILLALAALLASLAVSVVGVIGFVGLMAPHIARSLTGGRHGFMLPVAALVGLILCAGADALGRVIAPPLEISAGILTALMGAPFFIWLLLRAKHYPEET